MAPLKISFGSNKSNPARSATKDASAVKGALGGDSDGEDEGQFPSTTSEKAAVQGITTFDDPQELEYNQQAPPISSKPDRPPKDDMIVGRKPPRSENQPSLSSLRDQSTVTQEAQSVDPSIYDYDAYHTTSSSAIAAAKRAEAKADAAARVPKYMAGMHAAAETRKRDQLMAQDKLLQREREKEGEDYGDNEKFVTTAYKQQQEEVRRAEEEEKKREELEMKGREGQGMSGFYKKMMEEEEQRHRVKVEASNHAREKDPDSQDDEQQDSEKEAAELARKLQAEGVNVALNEEGQVTDKRQLLKAGLNAVSKSKAPKVVPLPGSRRDDQPQSPQPTFDAGRSDAKRAMRERQGRMIEAQLVAQAKRQAEEDAEQLQKQHQAAKSTKTKGDISDAKERYLQRKREAAAAKAAGLQ